MGYFICDSCGISFDIESAAIEVALHNEVNPSYSENFAVCPCCGSSRYRAAAKCERCGEVFLESKLRGGYFCDDCLDEMTTAYHLKEYAKEMRDDFAEWMHERRANAKNNQLDYLKMKGNSQNAAKN